MRISDWSSDVCSSDLADPHGGAELLHLGRIHHARMIVFVAGERRAMALDRIGDEQGRLVVFSTVERLDQRLDAMPAEIGHELGQRLVIKAVEQDRKSTRLNSSH